MRFETDGGPNVALLYLGWPSIWIAGASRVSLSLELVEQLIEANFQLRRIPYAICAGPFSMHGSESRWRWR
jgi:hypothetical protein